MKKEKKNKQDGPPTHFHLTLSVLTYAIFPLTSHHFKFIQ